MISRIFWILTIPACIGIFLPSDRASARADDLLDSVDLAATRAAVEDLAQTFGEAYPKAEDYLNRIDVFQQRLPQIRDAADRGDAWARDEVRQIHALQREALLANPLLDFDRLLLIKRKPLGDARRPKGDGKGLGKFLGLPQQSSWQQDEIPNVDQWENELVVMTGLRGQPKLQTLFRPATSRLVGDIDLHYDAQKIAFSMPNKDRKWQVFEIDANGKNLRQLTMGEPQRHPETLGIHNFDPVYLPDGRIAFASTAPLQGVPCNTSVNVAMTYRMDADGSNIQQLCFDQDHNYCPTVTNDGRIMYLRWEYTDIPHVWGRYLFTMNPDGTGQREYYGSGGYWPNSIFYARSIPQHPTKVVGIVTGHHVGRVGELVVFDPGLGRNAVEGVVQRLCPPVDEAGRDKKVEPLIQDKLTEDSWPKFLHPYPLSEKHFLVSAKPGPNDLWGIYLVDTFDNIVLVKELEGYALLEPIPFRAGNTPPVIPDRVNPRTRSALVYMENVYQGPGLAGVPHGSVKKLRLFTYNFAYQTIAGISHRVGADGPWEPKRVLGTVPVEEDGSAMFRVPAKTPISIQPLDAEGKALALMRSWTTAMPGEIVSCVGCHEKQNSTPPNRNTIAAKKDPCRIEPLFFYGTGYGPVRGFSFARDVQPVVDKYCVTCHDGTETDGNALPDLRADQGKFITVKSGNPKPNTVFIDSGSGESKEELFKKWGGVFEPSYFELRRYVRVGGFESDIRLLKPREFGAGTSELIQMLRKGHHGVRLDREAWDRLYTWIDLNAPCYGTWQETVGPAKTSRDHSRRIQLRKLYAGVADEDPEALPESAPAPVVPVRPSPMPKEVVDMPEVVGWPFDADEAGRRQAAAGADSRVFDLGDGVVLEMARIPAGRFVMGDPGGHPSERVLTVVEFEKPFWIGKFEITNEQYARFDPDHDSRFEHKGSWVFSEGHLGWRLNHPRQPVVRVSQQEAQQFCRQLSREIGVPVNLPTEAQWEYACRAGTAEPLWYGDLDTDFSKFANMADATMKQLAYDTDGRHTIDMVPRDARFDDGKLVTAEVGSYLPNPWGMYDTHGNVGEWTRTIDQSHGATGEQSVVVRGGSWRDRPKRCRSAFRLSYPAWQKVYNVGFRIVCESDELPAVAKRAVGR